MKRLRRSHWLLIAAFVTASSMLAWSGWQGMKFAIITLAVFNVALAVLCQLNAALLGDVLDTSRTTLEAYGHETIYAQSVTSDYVQVLGLLYEHDPSAAEVFQDRLSESLTNRHPGIAVAAAERAEQAGMN